MTPYPYVKYDTDLSLCAHCPENFSLVLRDLAGDGKKSVVTAHNHCTPQFTRLPGLVWNEENRPVDAAS